MPPRPAVRLLCLACVCVLPACVTEVRTPSRPSAAPPDVGARSAVSPDLPQAPIASPADTATTLSSHVRVALQPIGNIPFDGQTLPIISPDGRFLATQVGRTPTWPMILGEPGAPLATTHIERYELTDNGPHELGELDAPLGTLLGQRVSASGIAVWVPDEPNRREAHLNWLGNAIDPMLLATVGNIARFTLGPDGALFLRMEGASRQLAHDATAFTRYQAFSSLQDPPALPRSEDGRAQEPPGFLFFHPGAERMAIYVFATQDIVLLAPHSIAGAWHVNGDRWGMFLTTPDGLQFQAIGVDKRGVITVGNAARVLDEAYVPRSTSDPEHPYVLIGPGKSSKELQLVWMTPVTDVP